MKKTILLFLCAMSYMAAGAQVTTSNATITFSSNNFESTGEGCAYASDNVFTIGTGTKVCFSKGNLQFNLGDETWRFAENQYDYIGNNPGNTDPTATTANTWIDLFAFGTSGYNNLSPRGTTTATSSIAETNYDWGVFNAITNGGNASGQWRTLTSAEWNYLFNTRTSASSKYATNCTVNGQKGLIILPDRWSSSPYDEVQVNTGTGATNTYTISQWQFLEAKGAIFLPRDNSSNLGYYWTGTQYNSNNAYCLYATANAAPSHNNSQAKNTRHSVRLVQDYKPVGAASNKAFTVSSKRKVYFSKGNLQYSSIGTHETYDGTHTEGTYSFCENQWETGGTFTCTAQDPGFTTTLVRTKYDWGYEHAIVNAGNQPEKWRMLEASEWGYLLNTRANATNKWAWYKVNGVSGLVILPDDWVLPAGVTFTAGMASGKTYTVAQWKKMEAAGAIFLPIEGEYSGNYWSCSRKSDDIAGVLDFAGVLTLSSSIAPRSNTDKAMADAYFIRLVSTVVF